MMLLQAEISPHLVTTFISAMVASLLLALIWFVKRWIATLDLSIEKLNTTMEKINVTLLSTERRLDQNDRDHEDHAAALRHLWAIKCTNATCPYADEETNPGTPPFFYLQRGDVDYEGKPHKRRHDEREGG